MRGSVHRLACAVALAGVAVPTLAFADSGDTTLSMTAVVVPVMKVQTPRPTILTLDPVPPKADLFDTSARLDMPSRQDADLYTVFRVAPGRKGSPYAGLARRLKVRGTGMIDGYANGSFGLRLSGGGPYLARYYASDTGPGAAAGSMAKMRLPRGAVTLRDGYEYNAPVALVGYDVPVSSRMKIGVEGGMMKGRAAAIFATDYLPGGSGESHYANNPVGDVTMTYRF